jgi:diguanylate cyclase (GGDEF)-like protein/PAS domain S-box-containing protein
MEINDSDQPQEDFAELRQQAEEVLSSKSQAELEASLPLDAQKLITELQVHQIELQMQNDELRKAQVQLAAEREKYADLYNFAPVAYFTVDDRDLILDINQAGAELLGHERKYLINHPITSYLTPESLQTFVEHRQMALKTGTTQSSELMVRPRRKAPIYVHVHTVALRPNPESPQLWRSVLTDITERKRGENILQAHLRITEFAAKNSLSDLLQNTLDEFCALTDSPIGFFHFVEPDQKTLALQAWSTRTLAEMCTAEGRGSHYDIDQAGVWVDCVREMRPVIHNDYASLPHRKGLPDGHAPVIREMVFPIIRNQKIVAIVGVGNKPQEYTQDDVNFASRLADLIWDIVERKRAEKALQESETRYRRLVENSPDVVYTFSNKHGGIYYSPRAEQVLGHPVEYLYAHPFTWNESIHPEDRNRISGITNNLESGKPFDIEYRIQDADGNWRWLRDRSIGQHIEKDELVIEGLATDVTERKLADEIIKKSERRFRSLIENSTDGLTLLDRSGAIIYEGPSVFRLTGYEVGERAGRSAINTIYPEDVPVAQAALARVMAARHNQETAIFRLVRKDGSVWWTEATATNLLDEPDVRAVVINYHDITERKQSQERIQQAHDFYLKMLRDAPALIWRAGLDAKCNWFNQTWLDFTGRSLKQELGDGWTEGIHPDDFQACVQTHLTCFAVRQPFEMEYRLKHHSGEYRWILDIGRPLLNLDNSFGGYIGYCFDVTERKLAENKLHQANADLKAHLEEIEMLEEQLREQAIRDYLTGLFNRGYLQETLNREIARVNREKQPVGIIIMDVDYFKRVNDSYGHAAGDSILNALGNLIKANIRLGDVPCRYGGEEFVIVLPGASLEITQERAVFIHQKIGEMRVPHESQDLRITVSMGVAAFPLHGQTGDDVLIRADRALYQAKQNGRNQVATYRAGITESLRLPKGMPD